MKMPMLCLLTMAVLYVPAAALQAQIYKWKDAHGTVHFSQAPPTRDIHYSQVKTNVNAAGDTTGQPGNSVPAPASVPAAMPTPPERTIADTPANRKALCASLDKNLQALQGSGPVVLKQDGKFKALDATQRKQQLAAAQARQQQYCQAR